MTGWLTEARSRVRRHKRSSTSTSARLPVRVGRRARSIRRRSFSTAGPSLRPSSTRSRLRRSLPPLDRASAGPHSRVSPALAGERAFAVSVQKELEEDDKCADQRAYGCLEHELPRCEAAAYRGAQLDHYDDGG